MNVILRELKFAIRDRVVILALISVALLSSYSVISGLTETRSEQASIERITKMVNADREYNLAKQTDPGGAAYYAFHFTYDPPSSLAFISRGVRDDLPWKHRIRMLALEGQIYETDAGNSELSRIGKLDFAFVAAFLLPLLSILLLYDLRAVEIRNNRWEFLSATSGNGNRLLLIRAVLRTILLFICTATPFLISATVYSSDLLGSLLVIASLILNLVFWCFLGYNIFTRIESGPTIAAVSLGCWLIFCVVIPVAGKYAVEQLVAVPKGGEILLTQREAVNDAWDLPKEATMTPFIERHPEWANTPQIAKPFEWKWYYAFQQVGDQTVEDLSTRLHSQIARRDQMMSFVSLLSPPLLTKLLLSRAANTDVIAFQHYENCVREFHLSLRKFHYPMLFGDTEYTPEYMQNLPVFEPCSR